MSIINLDLSIRNQLRLQVSPICRRARVTMRLDLRSRLADVDGCRKGYFTVSPIMKEAK